MSDGVACILLAVFLAALVEVLRTRDH